MSTSDGIAIALVLFSAAFYAFIGVNAMLRPHTLLRTFDVVAETPAARNEVRTVYGGLPLAMCALLIASLITSGAFGERVLTVGVITLAMAVARLASALIDRAFAAAPRLWCLLELLVAGALFTASALAPNIPSD